MTAAITEYGGFELAIGSVFAVRWFRPDRYGRLHAVNHSFIWKPGENVAKCQKDDGTWLSFGNVSRSSLMRAYSVQMSPSYGWTSLTVREDDDDAESEKSLADEAVEAKIQIEHVVPHDSCGCGVYAFAEGCDDNQYRTEYGVHGVIECYGRTILGTRGLRCEKARVVGLVTEREDIKRNYPDVQFFTPTANRFRKKGIARAVETFDIVQPYTPTPDDPDFWERP